MNSRPDLRADLAGLTEDCEKLANENARLRQVNAKMLYALQCALPLVRDALPDAIDFDWTEQVVAKIQNAIAESERSG